MEFIPIYAGILGIFIAVGLFILVLTKDSGSGKIEDISNKIHLGAMTFIKREYSILFMFVAIVAILIFFSNLGPNTMYAFLLGAFCSALAGFFGMYTATKANSRTTQAAHINGLSDALNISFFGGAIMGMSVAALGVLGLGILYIFFGKDPSTAHIIHGFGMGASSVALFSRVGGGIFTKSADVGADLVGKVEAGIPEDDPRNPGVIADNVGDNVGDVTGMGSDIFESYCGAIIATIAIASSLGSDYPTEEMMFIPLMLASVGLLCSFAGIVFVKIVSNSFNDPSSSLRFGTLSSALAFIVASYFLVKSFSLEIGIWYSIIAGALGGMIIGLVTEYFTAGKPVSEIAKSAETGSATVLIKGLSVGMVSVVVPILTIVIIIFVSNAFTGLYGVGIAAVGMLATVGMTMAIDAYGPIADNAGGIAEMADLGEETRKITDNLDEVGNTTAAIGKGFAIGAAALAALAIITAYIAEVSSHHGSNLDLSLNNPYVLIGLFIGGVFPYFIAALTMTAVGDAAFEMIKEIRRQFKEIPGLLEGKAEPDTVKCVDIATSAALKKMILPGASAVALPIIVGFSLGPETLGGVLGGALLSCVMLALTMANAGGAWDNAKKYIEKGNFGGKGSEAHKAAVVGDTVGDPFKDTSGPSMNILINVMAIVSLVIAPLL
ncbi:MAG: putative K(+)-stimulated pyrophosphate-energized sodium pump [Thiotrichaceae bacterium]|jgi:K(+)-stimulated pyrophosphate-energized sodium pump|nr:MAG: putative K(+)-stimulated pyrophosphate-energized sodium pump [Thiotrichaceae bacterium]|tara:strand:- start:1057 stop:3048 length:1992 start_codon:yes stop_codon:yes gene_type:complete